MTILLVDDQPETVEPLRAELAKLRDTNTIVVGFDKFDSAIKDHAPHIIVLDLALGNPANNEMPGLNAFQEIWDKRFCPIIVYSAVPEWLEGDQRLSHPFVKCEKKGSGSEERVIQHVREFEPHVTALDEASSEISWAVNRVLREVAPRIFDNVKDTEQRRDILVRSARRRVAAAMDSQLSTGGPSLRSWEHYLCPPTTPEHLLTGDIIRKRVGDTQDPSNYAVVLTPSCDLVSGEKRRPRVDKVLVATCTGVQRLVEDVGLNLSTAKNTIKQRLLSMLHQGHGSSCLPLPSLPGEFPAMAADFRKLELISLEEIGGEPQTYIRVASVDNPFRELVAWAYMITAARPGLPERDCEPWADEIVGLLPEPDRSA